MSTPVTTYDKRPVIVSPTAPTSLEQLKYLWLDISETTPVLRYYNSTGIWEAINDVDTSSFLTTNGVQTITGAKTFNTGTITVADITVNDVTIEGIDTIKLTDDDTHVPTSKLVEDTLVSAISGLETSIDGELAAKANDNEVVKLTGDQIVQGVKEFGNDIYFNGSILFGTSSSTMSSFNNVDQDFVSPSTTTVPSTQAVANALSEKQNTLKYYSEGTNTVTIETVGQPNNNISVKAGDVGIDVGWDAIGAPYAKFGTFSGADVSAGITASSAHGHVDITAPVGFKINNSTPNVTTIVDSINLQSGGENALPTASAVRTAVNQIKTDLGSALTYKGSVDTYDQLPEEAEVGDTWNVAQAYQTYPAGTNYAWTGTAWDALGGSVDLSGYQTKSDDTLATSAKTVVGAINEVNTTLSNKQDKLLYYSETSGATPSATISAANIKFTGRVAEGGGTTASGQYSHAEGVVTTASGDEGTSTTASGITSHAEGNSTIASSDYQHAQGKFNIEDVNDKYADIIGNGTSPSARSNAATVSWEGIAWSQTDVRAGGTDQDSAAHSLAAKQNATDNTLTTTAKTITGAINELSVNKQNALETYKEKQGNRKINTTISSSASDDGGFTGDIIIHTNGVDDTDGAPHPGNITLSTGKSSGSGGSITLTTGDDDLATGASLVLDNAVNGGNITLSAGGITSTPNDPGNITLESASGNLELNVAKITGSAVDSTISSSSTDNHIPTSKAVYDSLATKQNILKYYSESDSSTEPSSNNAQVSILKNSDYQGTLNLGFESSNGIQTINIGGSSNDRRINIGTKICGNYNNVTIGNASDGVLLTLNTGRGLAGTGVTKDLSTSATDAQFPTAAAVNNQLILKQNITDNTLTTTAKTIVGAINELKTATDAMVVVSTDNAINVAPTTAQTGVLIASSKTNGGNVIITPKITNTGACYLSTSSTYSNLNPIYPDPTNNKYTYPDLGTVYLFVDNAGDSADIVIENFAG